jgi:hypothetical protein
VTILVVATVVLVAAVILVASAVIPIYGEQLYFLLRLRRNSSSNAARFSGVS